MLNSMPLTLELRKDKERKGEGKGRRTGGGGTPPLGMGRTFMNLLRHGGDSSRKGSIGAGLSIEERKKKSGQERGGEDRGGKG